jgi:transposase
MEPVFARGDFKVNQKLEKLLAQAIKDRVPKVMLRIQGILMSLEGKTTGVIAHTLRVHRSTVPLWIQNWNQHGVESLPEGHRCGRPASLSPGQRAVLAEIINNGPVAAGFSTGIWTSPLIAQVIAEEFSQIYHPGHVRKLLKQMGYSVQRPIASLVQADLAQHRKWVRYTYPNLKKTRAAKGR